MESDNLKLYADASFLPPVILYLTADQAIEAHWVVPIDLKKHTVNFTAFPNGWTLDDIGLSWLEPA
jgi:hypothetical protein